MRLSEAGAFALLCLIWGTTWIATKAGVGDVPPLWFAGTRFAAAGLLLGGVCLATGRWRMPASADAARLIAVSLTLVTLCYGLLFSGIRRTPSGLAGVVEMSLTPVALLAFGVMLRVERFDLRRAAAMLLGAAGIAALFLPDSPEAAVDPLGLASVAAAAFAYGLGAVLSKGLIERYGSLVVSATTMSIGGAALIGLSLLTEPVLRGGAVSWSAAAVGGWLYLLGLGSLIAYPTYLWLLRRWGPSRSGSYAFVSSIVAVLAGAIVLDEPFTMRMLAAMGVLLGATALALRPSRGREDR